MFWQQKSVTEKVCSVSELPTSEFYRYKPCLDKIIKMNLGEDEMSATILALTGYIAWTLLLLVTIAVYRTVLVMQKNRLPNGFKADGSDSPEFGQRLTRAQGNCAESFVFTGGVMLLALATSSSAITDPLAYYLLAARLVQSIVHLLSTSVLAVQIRFAFFVVQVVISGYWLLQIMSKFA